jgi:hypothetical protein
MTAPTGRPVVTDSWTPSIAWAGLVRGRPTADRGLPAGRSRRIPWLTLIPRRWRRPLRRPPRTDRANLPQLPDGSRPGRHPHARTADPGPGARTCCGRAHGRVIPTASPTASTSGAHADHAPAPAPAPAAAPGAAANAADRASLWAWGRSPSQAASPGAWAFGVDRMGLPHRRGQPFWGPDRHGHHRRGRRRRDPALPGAGTPPRNRSSPQLSPSAPQQPASSGPVDQWRSGSRRTYP